jgi:hypothetical protein
VRPSSILPGCGDPTFDPPVRCVCDGAYVTACVPNFNNEVFEHSHLVCWVTRVGDDTREMRDSLLLSTGSAPDGGGDGELLLHQGHQLHHRDQLAPRTGAAAATSRRKERQTAQRSKVFFLLSFVGWIGAVLLLSYSVEYPEEPGTALRFWSVLPTTSPTGTWIATSHYH